MIECKFNYKNDATFAKDLWRCDSCLKEIETQSHILHCEAYKHLRKDKDITNDEDIVEYYKQVMEVRNKLNVMK